jgi:hypothetical protein
MALSPDHRHSEDARPDVLTRRELLEMRGYEPEVVNGNGRPPGSTVLVADTRNAPEGPRVLVPHDDDGPQQRPACTVCGEMLSENRIRLRAKTCAGDCAAEHLRTRRAVNEKARRDGKPAAVGNHRPEPVAAPPAATGVPERSLLELLQSAAVAMGDRWTAELESRRVVLVWTAR